MVVMKNKMRLKEMINKVMILTTVKKQVVRRKNLVVKGKSKRNLTMEKTMIGFLAN